MSQVQSITLRDFDAILPQYIVVHHIKNDAEWHITDIEILDEQKNLLADGIEFNQLPKPTQMAILGALNTYEHEAEQRTRGLMRLMADINADVVAARAWN
jgi:hypothetical protein